MAQNMDVMLKRFEHPDEVRTFEKGKFEIVRIGGMTIGRATYEPGWRWSMHVGPAIDASSCSVEHVGIVVSGRAIAAMDDGTITEMHPGDLFHIAPGHDSWSSAMSGTSLCIFSARTTMPAALNRRSKQ
jgi:quercetin dioxygenase-like cupin family protein